MTLSQLTVVDYLIVLVVLVSVIISLIRGFVREALSLATWIAAVWVTYAFTGKLSEALVSYIPNNGLRTGLSIIALFLVTLAIGTAIGYVVNKFVSKSGLSGLDRLVGLLFGGARGLLIITLGIIGINLTSLSQSTSWQTSAFLPYFKPATDWMSKSLPDYMQHQGKKQAKQSKDKANDTVDDELA